MEFNSKLGFEILIISGAVIIPLTVLINDEFTKAVAIEIDEDTVFDPLCLKSLDSESLFEKFCSPQGDDWYMDLGTSTIMEYGDVLPKLLFLKIDISKIPKSDIFNQITILQSDLEIGFLYDAIKYLEEPQERFFITYGACGNTLWSENTQQFDLPCIKESGHADMQIDSFYGIVTPERVTKIDLNLKTHITAVQKANLKSFTEIVSFSAGSFVDNYELEKQTRDCLISSPTKSEKEKCLEINQLLVYSSEFSRLAFKPFLFIEYHVEPSVLTKSISTVVFAVYPLIGSFLIYIWRQEKSFKNKMLKVCGSIEKEVQDTRDGLKIGVDNVKPTKTFKAEFDKNYGPIVFKLSSPITEVFLFTDAYTSIINSGSFENFTKDHQIEISTIYNLISEYNKTLEMINQTIESVRLSTEPKDSIDKLQWGLKTNLVIYLKHLALLRLKIIKKIEGKEGILAILKKEKANFQ